MLIEGLLIGVAAVVNLGGLRFIYKKLQREADQQFRQERIVSDAEKWFTIGTYYKEGFFSKSQDSYWIRYILKVSNQGNRKIETLAGPDSVQEAHLIKYSVKVKDYIVYLGPWLEGVLSIDEVKKHLPKIELVPNKELSTLK